MPHSLPETGFVRLANLLSPAGPIPVSKSTWWSGVKTGRFPKPIKLGPRITVWRVEDIRALIREGARLVSEQSRAETPVPANDIAKPATSDADEARL
jgi:prophage regulatory protein